MAYVAEIVFHVLPLSVLLVVLGPLFKAQDPTQLLWLCAFIASCPVPIFQLTFRSSVASLSWSDLYVGLHVFAFNLLQLYIFRQYDFVSMYAFRFVYYIHWHVVWGSVRTQLSS